MLLDFCRGATRALSACKVASVLAVALAIAGCKDSPSEPETGSLTVTISGLPVGAQNAVTVVGPPGSNYLRILSASETLEGIPPGTYTVSGMPVGTTVGVYLATPTTQQVVVSASASQTATVTFGISTGSMEIAISGLPAGSAAAVSITGPEGFARVITEATTITFLVPGIYSISSSAVTSLTGDVYSAIPLAQSIAVQASETPKRVSYAYALITGGLDVTITGLPFGSTPKVTVGGPGGFNAELTSSTSMNALWPGAYSVTAADVLAPGGTWVPSPQTNIVAVGASLTHAQATVTYTLEGALPPPAFNLLIDGMYVTQAAQNYSGTTPLVSGLPALLRVFVRSTTTNTAQPRVRVRLYDGGVLVRTLTINPPTSSAPTVITEGVLESSWNQVLDASWIRSGMQILADVDPANTIPEANEADNSFPADGIPFAPIVKDSPPVNLTFVPVHQQATGLTGDVTESNKATFLAFAEKVLPIRNWVTTVHTTLVTSAPALSSNGVGWTQVLLEVNALRIAEGRPDHYMGIVNVSYSSGVAGLGFQPGFTALAWDRPVNSPRVVAHELGHNFGRGHAPCGGPALPDYNYPYPGGTIGVYGYDIATGTLFPPNSSDLMGYCGFHWISDYNYGGIINFRASQPNTLPDVAVVTTVAAKRAGVASPRSVGPALVVWGQIVDGKPVLEPAFMADTRAQLPSQPGPNRIEALGANGRIVFSHSFEGDELADVPGHSIRQFAFAVPVDSSVAASIATIRLIAANGSRSEWSAQAGVAPAAAVVEATTRRPGEIAFRLRGPVARLAVVRERASGQIVAFVRGTPVVIQSRATEFDVQVSDGVRSSRHAIRP